MEHSPSSALRPNGDRYLKRRPTTERHDWLRLVESSGSVLELFTKFKHLDEVQAKAVKLNHVHRSRLSRVLEFILSAKNAQTSRLDPTQEASSEDQRILQGLARGRAFNSCTSDADILALITELESNIRLALEEKPTNPAIMMALHDAFAYMAAEARNGMQSTSSVTNVEFSEEYNDDIDGTPLADDDE